MIAEAAVLRDGETLIDHADPASPQQGPLTVGADLLSALSYDQLRCLIDRMSVVQSDCMLLGYSDDRYGLDALLRADAEGIYEDAGGVRRDALKAQLAGLTGVR